jgi:hypothetical protein
MDEVPLAVICDPKNMEVVRARGDDPDELIDLYIDAINHSIIDRPAEMTVCLLRSETTLGSAAADRAVVVCPRTPGTSPLFLVAPFHAD